MAKQPKQSKKKNEALPVVKVKKEKGEKLTREQRLTNLRKEEERINLQKLRKMGVLTRAQYRELAARKGL